MAIVLVMVYGQVFVGRAEASKSAATGQKVSNGWKWDVDIYDRPGWNSFTFQFPLWGAIEKRENAELQ